MGLIIFPIYIYLAYSITNSNVSMLCIIVILVELNENRTGRHMIFLKLINKILIISRPVYQKHLKLGLYFLLNDNIFNSRLCAKVAYYFSLKFYFEILFLVKILKLDI